MAWLGPSDERDRRLLDAWCSTVGPPALEPEPTPRRRTDTIAIVSWNVHVGGGDVAAMAAALVRGDLTGGRPVRDYVLLLQEAFRVGGVIPSRVSPEAPVPRRIRPPAVARATREIAALGRQLGLAWVYVPSMRNGRSGENGSAEDRGNAILSTLPLTGIVAIELPFERQRRVAVAATVVGTSSDGAPWQLGVASVHMDTGMAWTRGGPLAARARQADALVAALRRFGSQPVVAAGDFNTWLGAAEPAVRRMAAAFPDTPRAGDAATWNSGIGLGAPLDYLFGRFAGRTVTVRRATDRYGSDHYPLVAELAIRHGSVIPRLHTGAGASHARFSLSRPGGRASRRLGHHQRSYR